MVGYISEGEGPELIVDLPATIVEAITLSEWKPITLWKLFDKSGTTLWQVVMVLERIINIRITQTRQKRRNQSKPLWRSEWF